MGEPAAAAAPAGAPPPAAPTTTAAPAAAGATLASVPAGSDWVNSFKNDELKAYVQDKKFTSPEQMAERYQNLEKLRGVPDDRLLRLPEKWDSPEAKAVWEKLGTPKEAKGYEIPRTETTDTAFTDWAEQAFHANNLTKSQGQGLVKALEEYTAKQIQAQQEAHKNALAQADESLKKEWGPHYETNVNLAKQGARVLGLDAKTLDMMEAIQGRESLFKTLSKIGVSVGESNFVDGAGSAHPTMSAEQAQQEIKNLMQDRKFVKAVNRGDQEALKRWNDLNKIAAPGEKSFG